MPSHITPVLYEVRLTREGLRERMSGNLCRCAAYSGFLDAIADIPEDEAQAEAAQ